MSPARCYECNEICEYLDTKFSRTRLCCCHDCGINWEEIITEIPRPIKINRQVEPMMDSRRPPFIPRRIFFQR